jgi:hypothetical protein
MFPYCSGESFKSNVSIIPVEPKDASDATIPALIEVNGEALGHNVGPRAPQAPYSLAVGRPLFDPHQGIRAKERIGSLVTERTVFIIL